MNNFKKKAMEFIADNFIMTAVITIFWIIAISTYVSILLGGNGNVKMANSISLVDGMHTLLWLYAFICHIKED